MCALRKLVECYCHATRLSINKPLWASSLATLQKANNGNFGQPDPPIYLGPQLWVFCAALNKQDQVIRIRAHLDGFHLKNR